MRTLRHTILAGIAALLMHLNGFTPSTWLAVFAQNLLSQAIDGPVRAVDFMFPGVRIRSEPTIDAVVRGLGNVGDRASVHRHVAGKEITCPDGHSTADWLHITDHRTLVTGYVSACFL